jgi:hypothetical protein
MKADPDPFVRVRHSMFGRSDTMRHRRVSGSAGLSERSGSRSGGEPVSRERSAVVSWQACMKGVRWRSECFLCDALTAKKKPAPR